MQVGFMFSMIMIVFMFVCLILIIAAYVAAGLGISKVLRILRYPNPWMAWIPLANLFALGHVTADENGNTKLFGIEIPTMVFSLWFLLSFVFNYVPYIGGLLTMASWVIFFGTICIYIYGRIEGKPEEEVQVIGYLSGLIPLIALVKFLMYKEYK